MVEMTKVNVSDDDRLADNIGLHPLRTDAETSAWPRRADSFMGWAGRRAACRGSLNRTRVWPDLETAMSTVHNFTATTLEGRE
jgi:hypothetical protein